MAMIVPKKRKRGTVYYLVQNLRREDGTRYQHWIPCESFADAKLLRKEVSDAESRNEKYEIPLEFQILGTGVKAQIPAVETDTKITVQQLVLMYIEHHSALGLWEAATRGIAESISKNYIFPYIGPNLIHTIRTRDLQAYYDDLPNHPAVQMRKSAKPKPISNRTVREIHKLLRPAFAYAVTMGYIDTNPVLNVQLPRLNKKKRKQWTFAEVKKAFQCCDDPTLLLMLKLMFAATLRTGELTGLSYEDVHYRSKDGKRPYISVKKELARLSQKNIEKTKTEVYFTFPQLAPNQKTAMVLKKPKTASSVRNIYIPDDLAEELRQHIAKQKKEMENNGFPSYDLLFCHPNGNPLSDATLVKRFKKLIRDHGLREVDLYSLRHSGATFKLTMSHDIKAVQGDMGHTSSEMLLEIYSTITDESRQELADHTDQFFKALDETEQDGQQTTKKTNEDDTNTAD